MGDLMVNETNNENDLYNSMKEVIRCTNINIKSVIKEGAIDVDFLLQSLSNRGILNNEDTYKLKSSLLHKKESKK